MIQYDNAQIGEVVTHFVGNRLLEDGMTISKAPVSQTEELRFTLRRFLLSSFEIDESWHFTHETGLEFNVVWSLCRDIFKHPELLYDKSVDIAKYLYDQCNHNKIKGGELCMVYFTDVMLDGDTMDAIGSVKSIIVYRDELILCSDKGVMYSNNKGSSWYTRNSSSKNFIDLQDAGREILASMNDGHLYYSNNKGSSWYMRR